MSRIFFLSLLLFLACRVSAQTGREVSGVVQDTTGAGISGANVKLSSRDSLTVRTNSDGVFVFKNVQLSQFSISVTSLGFQSVTIRSLR